MAISLPRLARKSDDDLFQDSTMTFGEHLDELRYCLWMAVLGLFVGFLLGLLVGRQVVWFIQTPLERNLKQHLQEQAVERLVENGQVAASAESAYTRFVTEHRLIYEDVLIATDTLEAAAAGQRPAEGATDSGPAAHAGAASEPAPSSPTPSAPATIRPAPGSTPASGNHVSGAASAGEVDDMQPPDFAKLRTVRIWRHVDDDPRVKAKTLNVHEGFLIYIKASFIAGAILASPWVLYWLWTFVAAGLYAHERQYVYLYLPFSIGLFLAGAGLAFFFVFDPVLNFLFSYNRWLGIDSEVRISEWMSFVLLLPLGFGASFQLPLVMLFLERIGIFTVRMYLEKWRLAVLGIAFLSMVLTPSDPYSMPLMAAPLTLLYFGGILLCKYWPHGERTVAA